MTAKQEWFRIPQAPRYFVNRKGEILNPRRRKIKGYLDNGNPTVQFPEEDRVHTMRIARIVGEVFCRDYAPELCACHRNGNLLDCRAENLKWLPRGEVHRIHIERKRKAHTA